MDLSVIIPVLNESGKISVDVRAAGDFLVRHGFSGEIIVVDDGSGDDTADQARGTEVPKAVELEVISYSGNRGKGFAIRRGMEQSRGEFVMFADSGLCIAYETALKGLELLKSGRCDLAHGSRKLPDSRIIRTHRPYRHVSSRIFRWVVTRFMGIPREISDSQCGFKMYRGEVGRQLYSQCISERFMFDVEMILRAVRAGYKICEFPVDWNSDRDTRFRFVRGSFRSLWDLMAIRRALKRSDLESRDSNS